MIELTQAEILIKRLGAAPPSPKYYELMKAAEDERRNTAKLFDRFLKKGHSYNECRELVRAKRYNPAVLK